MLAWQFRNIRQASKCICEVNKTKMSATSSAGDNEAESMMDNFVTSFSQSKNNKSINES